MSDSKITLIGLNKYLSYENKGLFDYLTLPDGIDKDTLCSNILQRGSEFEAQYPDPDYMRVSVGMWAKKWFWTFERWVRAINTEYNPLENYDRYESWKDNNTHKDTTNNTHKDNDTINSNRDITNKQLSESNSTMRTDTTDIAEVEQTKSAYDSGSYSPYEKTNTRDNVSETSNVHTTTNTNTTNNDKYNESRGNNGEYNTVNNGDYENVHEGHLHGNIGVTSAQDMLTQELNVAYFNLYERITDIFLTEYTIPIYI